MVAILSRPVDWQLWNLAGICSAIVDVADTLYSDICGFSRSLDIKTSYWDNITDYLNALHMWLATPEVLDPISLCYAYRVACVFKTRYRNNDYYVISAAHSCGVITRSIIIWYYAQHCSDWGRT